MLRIVVPNLECHCIEFLNDGTRLLSGWSDGTKPILLIFTLLRIGSIRVFRPQSGKLIFQRSDAHHRAVRSLTTTLDNQRLITGAEDGTVRVWKLLESRCELIASMKEHRSSVNAIRINRATEDAFVSCSDDGSCVFWDLTTLHRLNSLSSSTCFKSVEYHPEGSQIVTASADRKVKHLPAIQMGSA